MPDMSGLLRTPEARFAALPGFDFQSRYVADLPGLAGVRVHFLDEGPADSPVTVLCLHGNPTWSFLYRHMIAVFRQAGLRVVAPDLVGFGRSDKPVDMAWHRFDRHREMLLAFIGQLQLRRVMLVCQDWGGILGLTLPMALPGVVTHLLAMNTTLSSGDVTDGFRQWRTYSNSQPDLPVGKLLLRGKPDMTAAEAAAYDAPFPDTRYKAALRAFPDLVPDGANAPGADISRLAQSFWRDQWAGASFMAVGMKDPVLGLAAMQRLQTQVRGCEQLLEVPNAGHFVQEWGGPVALAALRHFGLAAG